MGKMKPVTLMTKKIVTFKMLCFVLFIAHQGVVPVLVRFMYMLFLLPSAIPFSALRSLHFYILCWADCAGWMSPLAAVHTSFQCSGTAGAGKRLPCN